MLSEYYMSTGKTAKIVQAVYDLFDQGHFLEFKSWFDGVYREEAQFNGAYYEVLLDHFLYAGTIDKPNKTELISSLMQYITDNTKCPKYLITDYIENAQDTCDYFGDN